MKLKLLLLTALTTISLATATMAQVPNYVPTNGLIGWWPFNGNAYDESGYGNHGIVSGALLTKDRFGNLNKSYDFNGINDNITISNAVTSLISKSYSVSFWIFTNDLSLQYAGHELINDRDLTSYDFKFRMIYGIQQPSFHQYTYLQTCNTYPPCYSVNTFLPTASVWEHYVMTYDNSNIFSAYKNGVLLASIPNTIFSSGNRQINIGRSVNPANPYGHAFYRGLVDDIGIWNRALTQQEVTALYKPNNTGVESNNPITTNNIKIFPNPTNGRVTIDFSNFESLNGYQFKIINSLSQQVLQENITQQSNYLNLKNWGGNGLFIVQIIDPQGNVIESKKIMLQ